MVQLVPSPGIDNDACSSNDNTAAIRGLYDSLINTLLGRLIIYYSLIKYVILLHDILLNKSNNGITRLLIARYLLKKCNLAKIYNFSLIPILFFNRVIELSL